MPRRSIVRAVGVVAAVLTVVLVSTGCSGDDPPDAGNEGAALYEIRESQCDGIRAAGTITNRSGADAAFEITARFTYSGGSGGLPIRTTTTEVIADGESTDFSISSDRSGAGAASGCRIVGADVVETDAAAAETSVAAAAPESWTAGGSPSAAAAPSSSAPTARTGSRWTAAPAGA